MLGGLGARVGWVDSVWDVFGAWGVVRVRACPGVVANGGPRQWRDIVLPQLQAGSFFKLIISGSIKMLKMCKYS